MIDVTKDPFYPQAVDEIVEITQGLPRDMAWPLDAIQQLMVIAWLRGASWKTHDQN